MQLAQDVLSKVPELIDYETTYKNMGEFKSPLDVVLLQEIQRYNALLRKIKASLEDLQKGIQGFVVMSTELEEIFTCMFEGRVPSTWLKGNYNHNRAALVLFESKSLHDNNFLQHIRP